MINGKKFRLFSRRQRAMEPEYWNPKTVSSQQRQKRKRPSLHRCMEAMGQLGKDKKKKAEMLENNGQMRGTGTVRHKSNKNRGTTQEH